MHIKVFSINFNVQNEFLINFIKRVQHFLSILFVNTDLFLIALNTYLVIEDFAQKLSTSTTIGGECEFYYCDNSRDASAKLYGNNCLFTCKYVDEPTYLNMLTSWSVFFGVWLLYRFWVLHKAAYDVGDWLFYYTQLRAAAYRIHRVIMIFGIVGTVLTASIGYSLIQEQTQVDDDSALPATEGRERLLFGLVFFVGVNIYTFGMSLRPYFPINNFNIVDKEFPREMFPKCSIIDCVDYEIFNFFGCYISASEVMSSIQAKAMKEELKYEVKRIIFLLIADGNNDKTDKSVGMAPETIEK